MTFNRFLDLVWLSFLMLMSGGIIFGLDQLPGHPASKLGLILLPVVVFKDQLSAAWARFAKPRLAAPRPLETSFDEIRESPFIEPAAGHAVHPGPGSDFKGLFPSLALGIVVCLGGKEADDILRSHLSPARYHLLDQAVWCVIGLSLLVTFRRAAAPTNSDKALQQ